MTALGFSTIWRCRYFLLKKGGFSNVILVFGGEHACWFSLKNPSLATWSTKIFSQNHPPSTCSLSWSFYTVNVSRTISSPGNEKTYPTVHGKFGKSSTQKCPWWKDIISYLEDIPQNGGIYPQNTPKWCIFSRKTRENPMVVGYHPFCRKPRRFKPLPEVHGFSPMRRLLANSRRRQPKGVTSKPRVLAASHDTFDASEIPKETTQLFDDLMDATVNFMFFFTQKSNCEKPDFSHHTVFLQGPLKWLKRNIIFFWWRKHHGLSSVSLCLRFFGRL